MNQNENMRCPPESITFSTQAEVDQFITDYPGCEEINGHLLVGGATETSDITDLTPLKNLKNIAGNLIIRNNSLKNTDGLNDLSGVGGYIHIGINPLLTELNSLSSLSDIGSSLNIRDNPLLTNLDGLSNLKKIGSHSSGISLYIRNNNSLENLNGLSSLTQVNEVHIGNNKALQNINGLNNLTHIDGNLVIRNNAVIENLKGLENVKKIKGYLYLAGNTILNDISAIADIDSGSGSLDTSSGYGLTISNNPALSSIKLLNFSNYFINKLGTHPKTISENFSTQDLISRLPIYPDDPKLFSTGTEGKRDTSEIDAGSEFKLEVIFVDWEDQPAKDNQNKGKTDFKELWKAITSGSKMTDAFTEHGVTKINVSLNESWKRMPKNMSEYFPEETDGQAWEWDQYVKDAVTLLGDSGSIYDANTIAVIVPNKGAKGFKKVGSGAHGNNSKGVRRVITLVPTVYDEHYTTLMHEIGHCFGSDELYPASPPYVHEVGGYDLMGDVLYATGFLGWHRYRYKWLDIKHIQYLKDKGNYQVPLKKISSSDGKSMIVIPDDKDPTKKYWVIEIGQDVISREQFSAGKGEKLNTEGERIIVYTVEETPVSNKRNIRLAPRDEFLESHGTVEWLDSVSYKQNQMYRTKGMPFFLTITEKTTDGFNVIVSLKE